MCEASGSERLRQAGNMTEYDAGAEEHRPDDEAHLVDLDQLTAVGRADEQQDHPGHEHNDGRQHQDRR